MESYIDKEGELLYKDKYYDIVVGIYKIRGKRTEKSNDGHSLYKGECIYCGKICNRLHIRTIKNTKKCHHSFKKWHNSRLGKIFSLMMRRCYNPNDKNYQWYGQKGIEICKEWLEDPFLFEQWALNNGYQDDLTIDRIDSQGPYCPGNCEWISAKDNSAYKTTTNYIAVDNKCHSGKEWAKILGVGVNVINRMMKDYGEDTTVEFIKKRLKCPTLKPKPRESWLKTYDLL